MVCYALLCATLLLLNGCTMPARQSAQRSASDLAKAGDIQGAEAYLSKAMQNTAGMSTEEKIQNWRMLSDLRGELGDEKGAARAFQQAVACDPADYAMVQELCAMLVTQEDSASAERAYKRYLKQVPGDMMALEALVALMEANGRYKEALPYYAKILEQQPDNIKAHLGTAQAAMQENDTAKALGILDDLLATYPGNAEYTNLRRELRLSLGACRFVTLAAGPTQSAAIDEYARLWMWGTNIDGAVGDGTLEWVEMPKIVMEDVQEVALGGAVQQDFFGYTLALDEDGVLWGWGSNLYHTINATDTAVHTTPQRILDNVASISAGHRHALAVLRDASLVVWGDGALSGGIAADQPMQIMTGIKQAVAGNGCTLAITEDGALLFWDASQSNAPGVRLAEKVAAAAAGYTDVYALYEDSSVTKWMDIINNPGAQPTTIAVNIAALSANGGQHIIMLANDGCAYVTGRGEYGALGLGVSNRFAQQPQVVLRETVAVVAGNLHSMALMINGDLYAWGAGEGRLGLPFGDDSYMPAKVGVGLPTTTTSPTPEPPDTESTNTPETESETAPAVTPETELPEIDLEAESQA